MTSQESSFSVETTSAFDLGRYVGQSSRLEDCAAWRIPGVITKELAASWSKRVLEERELYTNAFLDITTLGEAWYPRLENEDTALYFDNAVASDALVESVLPGAQRLMRELTGAAVNSAVLQRELWAGAGVHIFGRKSHTFRKGGVVHFDTEGLREEQVRARRPAVSCVLMLQPPEKGGALRLWKHRYTTETREATFDDMIFEDAPECDYADVHYEAGDFVIFDSYRAHQIQRSFGKQDRVSLTLHAVSTDNGWESWF